MLNATLKETFTMNEGSANTISFLNSCFKILKQIPFKERLLKIICLIFFHRFLLDDPFAINVKRSVHRCSETTDTKANKNDP